MKRIGFLSFTMLIALLFASLRSEQSVVSIELNISDSAHNAKGRDFNVKVLRDGNTCMDIYPEWGRPIKLDSVEPGIYEFIYSSIFESPVSITIDAKKPGRYSDSLYVNYFNYSYESYHPMIDRLRIDEEYAIHIVSRGCFHYYDDALVIKRDVQNYTAHYLGAVNTLDSSEKELLRQFELELNQIHFGGCTTMDDYRISYNGRTVKHTKDETCRWHGFSYLLKNLGFKEQ